MFLARRSAQAEYFDDPHRTFAEVTEGYRQLRRVNRMFHFADPFQRLLSQWLGPETCRNLSLLDLGAGDGSLGRELSAWAAQRGWNWRVTNLDLSPLALRLNEQNCSIAGSAVALPFREQSFDVVIASQMTHHLSDDAAVVQHFREAWRVTRDAIFLNDLHRNLALVGLVWLGAHVTRLSPEMRADGMLSVRRGWRVEEWRALAARAEISNADVRLYHGTRIILRARKRDRGYCS